MTREQVRILLNQHQRAVNRHDPLDLAALYAEDAVLVSPMFHTVHGRKAIQQSFDRLFEIYPDYMISKSDQLSLYEGDRAAEFSVVSGTQSVEIFGLPPTGHRIEYQTARLFTLRDGLIAGEQRIYDFGGVLERLEKTRVDRELAMASTVQQTLFARTASAGSFFDIVASSLPCRAIGGDFLEYCDLPSGSFGFAIGDVSGKGPAAALVAAMLQGMFSMVASEGAGPGDTLVRLNEALCGRGIEPRFATLFYGVLSADGRLHYSNAGHTSPLVVGPSGVRVLTSGGPILGVFKSAAFPEGSCQLAPGESVVACTDGVTEAASPDDEFFGMERLIAAASAGHASHPRELVEQLLSAVRTFCRTAPTADDATIVVLRYR